jgi:catechol 2,3-dioxygenase-like lactoylglutathione lyase family enzyme
MKPLRIERVIVATPDADAAAAAFRRLFGLKDAATGGAAAASAAGNAAEGAGNGAAARVLAISRAEIAFVTPAAGTALADVLATSGEGMAALRLEVADVDAAVSALEHAGIHFEVERSDGARVVHVDPATAHGVRLSLVGR